MASDSPAILKSNLFGTILAGVSESKSRPGEKHFLRIMLDGNSLCGCEGSLLGGRTCIHLKALIETLSREQLVDWILESTAKPEA